jgi:hypothetical protein
MTTKIKQQWRDGIVHTRTRSVNWILKNFVTEKGDWSDTAWQYAFSTEHTWLDADRPNRVCMGSPNRTLWIDQTSAREAIAQMVACEELFSQGLTIEQVYQRVEVI